MKIIRLLSISLFLLQSGCVTLPHQNEKFLLGQHICFITYRLGPADQMIKEPMGHTLYVFMSTTRSNLMQLPPACIYALAAPGNRIIGVPLQRSPVHFGSACILSVETNQQEKIIRTQLEGGDCSIILNGLMS